MSPTTKNIDPEDRHHVGDQVARQHLTEHRDVVERRRAQLEPPRRLVPARDEVVAVEAERVLGGRVEVALGHAQDLGQLDVDRSLRQRGEHLEAVLGQVEADVGLLQQHLEPRQAVAGGAGDHPARAVAVEQPGVGQVGLVAAQVQVDPGRPGDRPRDAVRRDHRRAEHADPAGAGVQDLVAHDHALEVGQPPAHGRDRRGDPRQPAGREVLLETADPVEHVVHPAAGGLLHHRLQLLTLAEGVEDRRDGPELEGVGAEEHQVVEHPVELGQQGAGPGGPLGHLHAEHRLDPQHHPELVAERREPVVPVGQHDDLPVVAHLEQLLRAAVHVADDRLGADDALAVDHDPQPQDAVGRRVLRADVEHHVRGGEAAGAHAHGELSRRRGRGHGRQSASARDRRVSRRDRCRRG